MCQAANAALMSEHPTATKDAHAGLSGLYLDGIPRSNLYLQPLISRPLAGNCHTFIVHIHCPSSQAVNSQLLSSPGSPPANNAPSHIPSQHVYASLVCVQTIEQGLREV